MATKSDTSDRQREYVFKANLEGTPDKTLETAVYLFDSDGKLIAAAPLKDGTAKFKLDETVIKRAQLAIGPAIPKERSGAAPKLDTIRHLQSLEPGWRFERDRTVYDLGRIPEIYWTWWLWCRCPVRGQVVKPVWSGGVYMQLPVCNARVHICEVDRFPWIIARIPDRIIWRLRDELIEKIRFPQPIPDPEPDPFPIDPGFVDPLPPDVLMKDKVARVLSRTETLAINPQPEPPGVTRFISPRNLPAMRMPAPVRKELPAIIDRLEPKVLTALASDSVAMVRKALIDQTALILPWICRWPWIWPYFYFCDEVAVVTTDAHGRFSTDVWYLCAGDHPDLYFWVETSIGGTWETVYHPPMACYTYWNYVCGTDVTIRVTDPRVTGCGDVPEVFGKKIVVKTIGRKISMGEIVRRGTGADPDPEEGQIVRDASDDGLPLGKRAPFGGTLEPRVDFGNGITSTVATHYRWSYRLLGSVSEDDWKVLGRAVWRHYRETSPPGSPVVYKSALVGPDPDKEGLYFKIKADLPAGGEDWEVLEERYDLASAYFDTASLPVASQGLKYELKLELFKPVGANMVRVDLSAADVEIYEITDPAPLSGGTYVTTAPTADRLLKNGMQTVGYRLVLHVDNRACYGGINDALLNGSIGAGRCGFLEYGPNDSVTLSFQAGHEAGFAWFSFWSVRVATALPSASASGFVDVASANGFNRSGDVFSKSVPVDTLLKENEVLGPGETSCTRAAFAEGLHVYALATDGYSRLHTLDVPTDLRAFALTPAGTS